MGVGDGVGSAGLKTGFGVGFGAAIIATPLFHTSLVPDLTQVNFFPEATDEAPTFVHLAPALTAAKEGAANRDMPRSRETTIRVRVITQPYLHALQI